MFGKVNEDSFQTLINTTYYHNDDGDIHRFRFFPSNSSSSIGSIGQQKRGFEDLDEVSSSSSSSSSIVIPDRKLLLSTTPTPPQQQQQQANTSRYKTELCRPYQESGSCKYAEKCQFAHGRHELRTVSRHPKHKTDLCRTYHSVGFCPYGPRCHFIHNMDEMKVAAVVVSNKGANGSSSSEMPPLPMFSAGRTLAMPPPQHLGLASLSSSEFGYSSSCSSGQSPSSSSSSVEDFGSHEEESNTDLGLATILQRLQHFI
jgi:hypothetical protein